MNKEELLEHFYQNYVLEKSIQKVNQLREYYEMNHEGLIAGFVDSFRKICIEVRTMQERKDKEPIGYITYSLLRTNLIRRNYEYVVGAFNDEWFYDTQECNSVYNVSWAYQFLEQFETELEEKRKLYLDKIVKPELEKLKLCEATEYHEIITELARVAMSEAVRLDEFHQIEKAEVFEVRVDDYKQISEVIYKEDVFTKDSGEMKEENHLEETFIV